MVRHDVAGTVGQEQIVQHIQHINPVHATNGGKGGGGGGGCPSVGHMPPSSYTTMYIVYNTQSNYTSV